MSVSTDEPGADPEYWSQHTQQCRREFACYNRGLTGLPTIQSPRKITRVLGSRRSLWLLMHYTPLNLLGTKYGWSTLSGQPTCDSTYKIQRMIQQKGRSDLVFVQMFDIFLDLYASVAGLSADNGDDFSFTKHFFELLSSSQQDRWWELRVAEIASMVVDEMVTRGRTGVDAIATGVEANTVFVPLIKQAVAKAKQIVAERGEEWRAQADAFDFKVVFERG